MAVRLFGAKVALVFGSTLLAHLDRIGILIPQHVGVDAAPAGAGVALVVRALEHIAGNLLGRPGGDHAVMALEPSEAVPVTAGVVASVNLRWLSPSAPGDEH